MEPWASQCRRAPRTGASRSTNITVRLGILADAVNQASASGASSAPMRCEGHAQEMDSAATRQLLRALDRQY